MVPLLVASIAVFLVAALFRNLVPILQYVMGLWLLCLIIIIIGKLITRIGWVFSSLGHMFS